MGGATLLSYTTSPMISLISDSMSVIMSAYGWSHTPILYDITYFSSHFRLHVRNHVCLWLEPHCYSIRHHLCILSFQTPCPRACLFIDGDTLLSFMTIPVYFLIPDSMSAIMSGYGWSHTAILYDITHGFSHFRLHVRNHISLWLEPHCYPLRHHLCFLSFQAPCSQSCLLIDRATLLSFLTIPMFFSHFRLYVRNHGWSHPCFLSFQTQCPQSCQPMDGAILLSCTTSHMFSSIWLVPIWWQTFGTFQPWRDPTTFRLCPQK